MPYVLEMSRTAAISLWCFAAVTAVYCEDYVDGIVVLVAAVVCLKKKKHKILAQNRWGVDHHMKHSLFPNIPENIDVVDVAIPFISLLNDEKKSRPVPAINPPPPWLTSELPGGGECCC